MNWPLVIRFATIVTAEARRRQTTVDRTGRRRYKPLRSQSRASVRFTRMPNIQDSPLKTYLDHLSRGELAYQFSPEAGRAVFYPRVICPFTGSDKLEWRVSKGLGTVYATTVVHPAEGKPFNVALIDCDEGFRLMSRVEDIAPEAVRIGQRVRFRVHTPSGDDPYPVFTPAEGA